MTTKNNTTATAKHFIERLKTYQSAAERETILRYFKNTDGEADQFIGMRMGQVFALVKEFITMTPAEIEKLLESKIHQVRAGGCSIMDKQARSKKTTPVFLFILRILTSCLNVYRITSWQDLT